MTSGAIGDTPIDELEREIVHGAAVVAAAMCRWLLLVAEFDRRQGYLRWERLSTADWLEWKCGIRTSTARDHVRVARALRELPKTRAAFASGSISYSKVRALARVADRESEADLLEIARLYTGNQLERMITGYERIQRAITLSDLQRMESKRVVQRRRDAEGDGWIWSVHVTDDEDALLQRGIDFVRDDAYASARRESTEPVERMSRIDAFVELVSLGLRGAVDTDGVPKENYLVVIHADSEAMVGDDGLVHLGDGVTLHPRTAQRLSCDAMAQVALDDALGNTLNLGRRARLFNRDQKMVKSAKAPTCEWPGGCGVAARYCTMHHAHWWTRGGATDLDNAVLLCRRHHKAAHEGGWELVRNADQTLTAVAPDGRSIASAADQSVAVGEADVDAWTAGVEPDHDPHFDPRPNLGYVLDTLAARHFPEADQLANVEAIKRRVRETFGRGCDRRQRGDGRGRGDPALN